MRILITSPAREATSLIAALTARGHEVIAIPLITPERIESPEIKLEGAQGFLVTSAEGARVLADAVAVHFFPVYAENAEAAEAARAAGFSKVMSAKGDTSDFARLIEREVKAEAGALVHACHSKETNAITAMLINMGYAVRPLKLYSLIRAETLPATLEKVLAAGVIEGAVVLSVDEARAFTTLLQHAKLEHLVKDWVVYATTTLASAPMRALSVARTVVAPDSNLETLLATFDQDLLPKPEPEPEPELEPELEPEPELLAASPTESPLQQEKPSVTMAQPQNTTEEPPVTSDPKSPDRSKLEPLTTGRTARLIAEDAADRRSRTQRVQTKRSGEGLEPDPIPDAPMPAAAAEPAPPKRSQARARKAGGFGRFVTYMVLLIIVAAAAFGTLPWWYPRMPVLVQGWIPEVLRPPSGVVAEKVQTDINALQQRLAAAESDIAALRREMQADELQPSDQLAAQATLRAVQQRITALEARPAAAPASSGTGADANSVTALGESVSTQAQQLAAVTARVATMENALGNTVRLEDLSERLGSLEDRSADASAVLALTARITQVETAAQKLVREQTGAVGHLLAVSQLQEAVSTGRPYGLELETVAALAQRLVGPTVETEPLLARAGTGVLTRMALQRRFDRLAPDVVRAGLLPGESAAWLQRALDRLLSVVNIRRLDDDGSAAVGAIVTRIETALSMGDLDGAVVAAESLTGLASETIAPWLTEARDLDAAENTVTAMTTQAVAQIAIGRALDNAPAASD